MTPEPPANVAVSVNGVSKAFSLPQDQVHTLKERVLHPRRRTRYEVLQALDGVSIDVEQGEFLGIVGRNGSGKTTLMKCLAGIYRVDAGEIWMRGRLAPFIELGVGFNPDLTARDNVVLNAIMFGLSPAEANARYGSIIEFAELERFVDLKLKNYSSGMQVRLAFSVMAHVEADVMLIDEVLAVGDSAFQRKCQDALLAASTQGRTILLVTHDMNAVQRFCHRAMLLEGGRVVRVGDPRAIARSYEQLNLASEQGGATAHLGDAEAAILDVWIEDDTGERRGALGHGEICRVGMMVEFHADVTDPTFGVVLSDDMHRPVFAATSSWRQARSGTFAEGERTTVVLEFENRLAAGRYLVSPEVAHAGADRRLMDHREDATTLIVTGGREGAGIVDLPHDFRIERMEPVRP